MIKIHQNKSKGFTLVELMITVAIISILVAIAYPSYSQWIQKSRRSGATSDMLRIMDQQEIFFSSNLTYTTIPSAIGETGGSAGDSFNSTAGGYYSLAMGTCAVGTLSTCVMITATPVGTKSQAHDAECESMALTSTGIKSAIGYGSTDTTARCWET